MTRDEFEVWLAGVRQWARERAEHEEEPPAPLYVAWGDEVRVPLPGKSFLAPRGVLEAGGYAWSFRAATAREAAGEAARLRMALVRDDTSPDGWRLVDLEVTP